MSDLNPHGKCARAVAKAILLLETITTRGLVLEKKQTPRDLVSNVDFAIHHLLRRELAGSGIPVVSEEAQDAEARTERSDGPNWVVDPVDGTTNFVSGIPFFGISVGLVQGSRFLAGAFGMPATREIFYTISPTAAYCNETRLKTPEAVFGQSLVGAAFSSGSCVGPIAREEEFRVFGDINEHSRGCLRLGSAGASICYAARGKLGAAYGFYVQRWDVAASLAIAKAAGSDVLVVELGSSGRLHYIVGKGPILGDMKLKMGRLVQPSAWGEA